MKTRLSLALMAILTASPAAFGNSIDYPTGTFQSGTLTGNFAAGGSVNASITGSLNTIDIATGTLTQFTTGCPAGSSCFDFSSGSVTVSGAAGTIFTDSISGGLTIKNGAGSGSISAVLTNGHGITGGDATATFDFSAMKITGGSEDVSFNRATVVPEPGTLLLVGSGLLGLVAKFRKRRQ